MYTLTRTCKVCGLGFKVELAPGEVWPDTCAGCAHTVAAGPNVCRGWAESDLEHAAHIDNKLGLQRGPQVDVLTPPPGDGTGRKRGW